ncbi:galactose oxidase, partial [Candidatus Frankia alpina]
MNWSRTSRRCTSRAFVLAATLTAALASPGLLGTGAAAAPTGIPGSPAPSGSPTTASPTGGDCPSYPSTAGPLRSWETVTALPAPRAYLAATTGCDGRIYA